MSYQEELQGKVSVEQQTYTGAAAVLGTMDGQEELAGDPQHLKEPGNVGISHSYWYWKLREYGLDNFTRLAFDDAFASFYSS